MNFNKLITSPNLKKRKDSPDTIRIRHAPLKPEPKGTPIIRQAVQSLKQKDHSIDYVEITGRPNSEVLQELKKCDFVVDEIYSDTPMAIFATEAAFAGKPAVVVEKKGFPLFPLLVPFNIFLSFVSKKLLHTSRSLIRRLEDRFQFLNFFPCIISIRLNKIKSTELLWFFSGFLQPDRSYENN